MEGADDRKRGSQGLRRRRRGHRECRCSRCRRQPSLPGVTEHELAGVVVQAELPEAKTVIVMVPSPLSTIEWSLAVGGEDVGEVPPVSRLWSRRCRGGLAAVRERRRAALVENEFPETSPLSWAGMPSQSYTSLVKTSWCGPSRSVGRWRGCPALKCPRRPVRRSEKRNVPSAAPSFVGGITDAKRLARPTTRTQTYRSVR